MKLRGLLKLLIICAVQMSCNVDESPEIPDIPFINFISTTTGTPGDEILIKGNKLESLLITINDEPVELKVNSGQTAILEIGDEWVSGEMILKLDKDYKYFLKIVEDKWQWISQIPEVGETDFANSDVGYYSSYSGSGFSYGLYKITERGKSVQKVKAGNKFTNLQVLSETQVFAVESKGRTGILWKTGDGGDTWTKNRSPDDFELHDFRFKDENEGWAVGTFDDGYAASFYHTVNGGASWEKKHTTRGRKPKIAYWSGEDIYMSNNSVLFMSNNGGETWQETPLSGHIIFTGADRAWRKTEQEVQVSADRGETWKAVDIKLADQYDDRHDKLKAIHFYSAEEGLMISSNGAIAKTSDSGETWEVYYFNQGSILAVDYLDDGAAIFHTYEGIIHYQF